jgi:hypothetical protein
MTSPTLDGEPTAGLRVECYAGHRGDESPERFYLGRRKVEVVEIIDRWLGPDHRYFKVRGDDGGVYILSHGTETNTWDLRLFDAGRHPETRLSST